MENKVNCLLCGKEVTANNSYIASHIKRIHKIDYYEYIENNYNLISNNFEKQKCGFCNNDAIINYEINHTNYTYDKNYNNGFICNKQECINNISNNILGHDYNKKTFEHIGSNSLYLSKKYKITIDEAKNLKYNKDKIITEKQKTSLNGYILRYGKEDGTKKYKERCDKISKSNKKEWYINKFGEEEGNIKWDTYISKLNPSLNGYILKYGEKIGTEKYKERCDKISKSNKKEWYINKFGDEEGNKKWNTYTTKLKNNNCKRESIKSKMVSTILDTIGIKYIKEYIITDINKHCDYFLEDYNTIIEYYGDYWHCNPKKYHKDYQHQYIKMSAEEIWVKDKNRIEQIYNFFNKEINIIILWESTIINKEYLLKILEDNKNKNNIIYV